MGIDFIYFILAFVEGLALILSPCILPILPILLTGSLSGGKKRPLGIILGFSLTFSLATFFSRFLVQHLGINYNYIQACAFILIILFGIMMVSDQLSHRFNLLTQKLASIGENIISKNKPSNGFFSGLFLGALVSLIWAPCAGPILAAILIQIATQKTLLNSFISLFMFSLGSVIPMIVIALVGKKLLVKFGFLKNKSAMLRKIFGAIIIIATLALAYINYFHPELFTLLAAPKQLESAYSNKETIKGNNLINAVGSSYPAPNFFGISNWINSPPLNISQLRGKVILVDFWTYSCINCIRTLPYLLTWDKLYRDRGLIIIGIHTPEFEFEKDSSNVKRAVAQFGIRYPVAQDNQYSTWLNYHNHYWPAHYLIDKNGYVVYRHFGEGEYDITEHNIQVLLGLKSSSPVAERLPATKNISYQQTPETYLGFNRSDSFANSESIQKNVTSRYTFPQVLPLNDWALQGSWNINGDNITGNINSSLKIHFYANHVYAVMGSADAKPVTIQILNNGKAIENKIAGKDLHDSMLTVSNQRLYELLSSTQALQSELTIVILKGNLELYTLTFG